MQAIGDEAAFCERLSAADVFVMPGSLCGIPGHFRVSLTASDEMVDRALPRFAEVLAGTNASRGSIQQNQTISNRRG